MSTSETVTGCQYKGVASWYHIELADQERLDDVAWSYERPISEAPKLSGLIGFYGEHPAVETLVGGEPQAKPEFDPSWLNPSLTIGPSSPSRI